jgi:hypothetical protein
MQYGFIFAIGILSSYSVLLLYTYLCRYLYRSLQIRNSKYVTAVVSDVLYRAISE